MAGEGKQVATWRKAVAAILDFFTAFFVFGYLIARFTGDTTEGGFELNGMPAIVLFVLVIAYFVIGRKFLGGTIWQRILAS
ncbi:MAG: hypothetical protein ACTSWM_02515 [Alphaproteobacteria bacterium]